MTIKVVMSKPGEKLEVIEIQNNIAAFKEIVGGDIEIIPLENYIVIVCKQSERINDDVDGLVSANGVLVGTILFAKMDKAGKEFVSLANEDIEIILQKEN
jgi:hypothetical protein